MSKLYAMNRMRYSPAAGGLPLIGLLAGAGKAVGKLFQSKAARAALAAAKKLAQNKMVQAGAAGAAGAALGSALDGGGGGGASGSWCGRRRRKGITATELRGFRKVSSLLHKEGMRIKKPGRRG